MKKNEIKSKVGDQVKILFTSHNSKFEVSGQVKEIAPNAIRVNDQFINFQIIEKEEIA